MIPVPRAEVSVDELRVRPLPTDLAGGDGPSAALGQGALRGLGDELLAGVEVPVETAAGDPLFCGLKDPEIIAESQRYLRDFSRIVRESGRVPAGRSRRSARSAPWHSAIAGVVALAAMLIFGAGQHRLIEARCR